MEEMPPQMDKMKNLRKLLVFGVGKHDDGSSIKELNSLAIEHYEGTSFPKWLGESSFSKMVSIVLSNCDYCFSLPPLGQLHDLKNLQINGFDAILSVGLEFYKNDSSMIKPFSAFKHLTFENMHEWQEWVIFEGEVFPHLQELYIYSCPKLSGGMPN